MEKGDVSVLAQLLTAMRDAVDKLEDAKNKNNMEELTAAKRAIMKFQKKIDETI